MDRTEAWNHSEPTGRWRSLLDRAKSGFTHPDFADEDDDFETPFETPFPAPLPRPYGDEPAPTGESGSSGGGSGSYQSGGYASSTTYPAGTYPAGSYSSGSYSSGNYQSGSYPATTYGSPAAGSSSDGSSSAYVSAPPMQPVPPPAVPARTVTPVQGRFEWRPASTASQGVDRLVNSLRGDLGGPRVIAFANPKGGVHKTTATVLAAATIGGVRGRGTIAWDDNELRGTLGLRAGSARHARTIRHLINNLATVEATPPDELLDTLDDYLRHASDGSYDVLAGEESPRFAEKLDVYTVRRVVELLRRTHEVICIDTGNNVESPNWRTVLQMADQLVVTSVPREDAAFTADWMLDLLNEVGMEHLVTNAVTLLSCPTPNPSSMLNDLAEHFATRTRAVAIVPYDPMLESGSSIDHEMLAPATRRAWLEAAGVILQPFLG